MAIQDILNSLTQTQDPNAFYSQIATYLHIPVGILFAILAVIAV